MYSPDSELRSLLVQGISATLHRFPEHVPVSELATVLTGMANSEGGRVFLGVHPQSGTPEGLRDVQGLLDRIFQAALLVSPPLVLPMPRIEVVGDAEIVQVTVPPGLPHAYHYEGRYLTRRGTRTDPLTPQRLRALMMERGAIQFEAQTPENATLDALDFELVAAYRETLALPPEDSLEGLLSRRGCLHSIDGQLRPTYAALLLFGRHPQQWVPSATILAARFSGAAVSDQFVKQEIRGTLPQQLNRAENFVRDQVRSVARLVGMQRTETPEYPLEAVRELLVNAVAHRDYNQQGDSIHLHIFADRLEVHSPGGLPGPVNLANLLEARFSRNAIIAQVLSDWGYVERLGYGLNRVVAVMRQNHLPEPQFEEIGGTFRVRLASATDGAMDISSVPDMTRYAEIELNLRQEQAIGYLASHKRLASSAYQELCPDVSPETLRRDLADLVDKRVLLKMGTKRGTYYILK